MNWTANDILREKAKMDKIVARGRLPANPILDYAAILSEFFMIEANCPCCGETETCYDDCTFAEDCPEGYLKMKAVREVLFG